MEQAREWLSRENFTEVEGLPPFGFRLKFDHEFKEKCKPFMLKIRQIPGLLGMSWRYTCAWLKFHKQGKKMFIDNLNLIPWRPIYGAPIGGIGSGTIGRGFKGEFCRFQMIPGMYKYSVVEANQFILTVRKSNETIYQCVLHPSKPRGKRLSAWKWGFPSENATYHALYPRSWTRYDIPECDLVLVCRQVSPVFPDDYQETCFPGAVFAWEVINSGPDPVDVSITFTFKNGQGTKDDRLGGVWNQSFHEGISGMDDCVSGVEIHQSFNDMPCVYGIAAKHGPGLSVSEKLSFDPCGPGAEVWDDLLADGSLKACTSGRSGVTRKGEELACAVCVKATVSPDGRQNIYFSLTWDMPIIHFGAKGNKYHRRYARYFGHNGDATSRLAAHALNKLPSWEEKIETWQKPILSCSNLPAWYKSALFNELYFISDGGTVWVDPVDPGTNVSPIVEEFGKFAYLEGHEYRMYNTFDVHHYASFALLMLWPKLQLSLQYDIASCIPREDSRMVKYCMNGIYDVTKAPNCVPHDIGDPDDEPWTRLNAYIIHPTQEWKDLNPKFVLQVFRDYVTFKNEQYLCHMYPVCKAAIEICLRWDVDNDGIIDNGGFADQTYDAWTVVGASAYSGGLWLAAVKVFCEMARKLGVVEDLVTFEQILTRGKKSYEEKLWNGEYYNYDSSSSDHHNSIMADQLAGQWYLKACGLPDNSVFPEGHVKMALESIFKHNVLPFEEGTMGAINGMQPNGSKDLTSCQSDEFWTGVTYALAATMLQEGLLEKGFQTGYGAYHTCWERYGLAFQTPEAYFDCHKYRSLGYMRPLSIWAMQFALERFHKGILSNS